MLDYFYYIANNPAFLLIIFGFILNFIKKNTINVSSIIFASISICALYYKSNFGTIYSINIFQLEIHNMLINKNTMFFGYMFLLLLLSIILFLISTNSLTNILTSGIFISCGGTLGVVFAGDYLSLFLMMEIILIGSVLTMLSSSTNVKTILKYLTVHSFASILIIYGIAQITSTQGNYLLSNLSFDITSLSIADKNNIAKLLICIGLVINIGALPFTHILINSYSNVSSAATLGLASFSTKAVLIIITNLFSGFILLKYIGIIMAIYCLILSLFEHKIRKILLLNMLSQFGIICVLVSIDNNIDIKSLVSIIICNHILYNTIMLMASHIILDKFNSENINMIKGIRHNLQKLFICVIIASFSSLSLPYSFGYITKNLLTTQLADDSILLIIISIVNIAVILNLGIRFIIRNFMGEIYFSKNNDISNKTFAIMLLIAILSAFGGNLIINHNFINLDISAISYSINDIYKLLIYWISAASIFIVFYILLKVDQRSYVNLVSFKYKLNFKPIQFRYHLTPNIKNIINLNNNMSVKLAIFILILAFIICTT